MKAMLRNVTFPTMTYVTFPLGILGIESTGNSHCDIPIRNVTFPTASWPHGRAAVEARSPFSFDLSPNRPVFLLVRVISNKLASLADAIAISEI